MNCISFVICSLLITNLHAYRTNDGNLSHDNILTASPVKVALSYDHPLPFYEPWDSGTFIFNDWHHTGNWHVNVATGNPAPCADFPGQPALTNYSDTLLSPIINADPYTCSKIYLDYDFKLNDRNPTGNEYLTVEEFAGGFYKKIAEYKNESSVNWTSEHIELKYTIGKTFRILFRSHGTNSTDIFHWFVDNIHAYANCKAPRSLIYIIHHNAINLSWSAPNCDGSVPFQICYDDDSFENGIANPPGYTYSFGNMFVLTPGLSGHLTSFDCFFYESGSSGPLNLTMDVYNETYNLIGSSDPFLQGNNIWQNIEVPSIPFNGTFYGMVNENGTTTRPNWLGLDVDGPQASLDYAMYYDGTGGWGTINSIAGTGPGVYLQRANGFISDKTGKAFTIAPGQDPYTNNSAGGSLQGYNVYRTDSTAQPSTFQKLNTSLVTTTTYTNYMNIRACGWYKYYITSVFNDTTDNTFLCESTGSDTINVFWPWGIEKFESTKITVFPNPATNDINVKCYYTIISVEVMDYTGRIVYSNPNVQGKSTNFNVSALNAGIYILKAATGQGTSSVKITVTH
ncbi:MAG: T9SS type A sorting domain-containing protein [Bacteroidetes bacterium]|nr:T9SS type A sorting domain-containing protein [Bacteroidota bacterium]